MEVANSGVGNVPDTFLRFRRLVCGTRRGKVKKRIVLLTLSVGCALAIGIAWIYPRLLRSPKGRDAVALGPRPYLPPAMAFNGDSRDLKQSIVVPTLDTPMPKGKNVIWCACMSGIITKPPPNEKAPTLSAPTQASALSPPAAGSATASGRAPGRPLFGSASARCWTAVSASPQASSRATRYSPGRWPRTRRLL